MSSPPSTPSSEAQPTKHLAPPLPSRHPEATTGENRVRAEQPPTISSFFSTLDPTPQRLSLHPLLRIPLLTLFASFTGFGLGFAHGAPLATYRYRAENAHRFPTTSAGWYLYHRTKGYHAIVGGAKHGVKMAGVLGASVVLFLGAEYAVDKARGAQDVGSTVVAGAAMGGVWAAVKSRREVYPAARMVRMGIKGAAVYGLAQDGVAWLRGNPPGYVRWVMGVLGRGKTERNEGNEANI